MLSALPLTARKMFGEYALYTGDTVVAFVCDNTLFIKPTPGALALLAGAEHGPACPGSKDYIIRAECCACARIWVWGRPRHHRG